MNFTIIEAIYRDFLCYVHLAHSKGSNIQEGEYLTYSLFNFSNKPLLAWKIQALVSSQLDSKMQVRYAIPHITIHSLKPRAEAEIGLELIRLLLVL